MGKASIQTVMQLPSRQASPAVRAENENPAGRDALHGRGSAQGRQHEHAYQADVRLEHWHVSTATSPVIHAALDRERRGRCEILHCGDEWRLLRRMEQRCSSLWMATLLWRRAMGAAGTAWSLEDAPMTVGPLLILHKAERITDMEAVQTQEGSPTSSTIDGRDVTEG